MEERDSAMEEQRRGKAFESNDEERRAKADVLFRHNPGYRQTFLAILKACEREPQALSDLEEMVAAGPGYEKLRQPPFFPISWLHEAGCLEEQYLDHEGRLYRASDVEDLTEDELDDLVATTAYETTEAGLAVRELFSPARKLTALLDDEPDRADLYQELLDYLQEKKSFAQIEVLIRGRDELITTARDGVKLQPSLFVDKLEAAGVIAYDGGWQITSEGKELLKTA